MKRMFQKSKETQPNLLASKHEVTASSLDNLLVFQEIARTTVSDYYIKTNAIEYKNTIRQTDDIIVYEGEWRYEKVCVKKIQQNDNICNELFVLSKCIHPKIVQFLGFNRQEDNVYIVFEYMENGNLFEYLRNHDLTPIQKIDIMLDVSIALHYLHNRYPAMVIHRDIKPTNILIDKNGDAKLSDFGISKIIQRGASNSRERGTYTWMAPEVLIGTSYNHLADIYSLGLVIYYIWTDRMPFDKCNFSVIQLVFAKLQYQIKVENIDDNERINTLVKQCTNYDQHERPNTETIIEQLKLIKQDLLVEQDNEIFDLTY